MENRFKLTNDKIKGGEKLYNIDMKNLSYGAVAVLLSVSLVAAMVPALSAGAQSTGSHGENQHSETGNLPWDATVDVQAQIQDTISASVPENISFGNSLGVDSSIEGAFWVKILKETTVQTNLQIAIEDNNPDTGASIAGLGLDGDDYTNQDNVTITPVAVENNDSNSVDLTTNTSSAPGSPFWEEIPIPTADENYNNLDLNAATSANQAAGEYSATLTIELEDAN